MVKLIFTTTYQNTLDMFDKVKFSVYYLSSWTVLWSLTRIRGFCRSNNLFLLTRFAAVSQHYLSALAFSRLFAVITVTSVRPTVASRAMIPALWLGGCDCWPPSGCFSCSWSLCGCSSCSCRPVYLNTYTVCYFDY